MKYSVCKSGLYILGGEKKGRRLRSVNGKKVRPLLSRIKKSLFDILNTRLGGAMFLDLFSGTGSVGLEALSRGASCAVFVENDMECIDTIAENISHLGYMSRAQISHRDVFSYPGRERYFDLIYIGPPYKEELIGDVLSLVDKKGWLRDKGLVIAQHHSKEKVPEARGRLGLCRQKRYGKTVLSFYSND